MKREGASYGIALMILSVVAFAVMATLVKIMAYVSPYVTVFVRFSVGIGILGILALLKKIKLNFVCSPLLLLRGISGAISVTLFYFAIVKIGMGKGSVYSYSYPVFASLLSALVLKEKISGTKWLLILSAFTGIVLVAFNVSSSGGFDFNIGDVLAICSAFTNAISILLVKKLHDTDDSYAIFFAQSIIGFWIFIIPANTPELTGNVSASYILILIGIFSAMAQLLNTEGYRHVSIATGSPFHMLIPVVNVIIGVVLFQEKLSTMEIVGAGIVVLSCLGIMRLNVRKH